MNEFKKFSVNDAAKLPEYYDRIEAVADVLRDLSVKTPPNPKQGIRAALNAALNCGPLQPKAIKFIEMSIIFLLKVLAPFLILGLKTSM